MTTIVATRNTIAGDSMVSTEGQWYPTTKVRRMKSGLIGAAGNGGDCVRLMDWAEAGFAEKKRPKFVSTPDKDDEAALLMVTKKGIFYMLASDPYPELVDTNFFAIGSGGKVALGALHAGATLEEAMEIAHRVDPYTRPPFDILTLKEKP